MFQAYLLILLALFTNTKGQLESSHFLVPALYSNGHCEAVPSPQTLKIYLTTQLEDANSYARLLATGRTTRYLLWALNNDNSIDNVFEYPLIALNSEATFSLFCLNFYCDEEPTKSILRESNGTCSRKGASSGVYGVVDNDPNVSFLVSNKGPDFMHVYSALPIGSLETVEYYILNPSRYQGNYIQAFSLRSLHQNGTEVTFIPTAAVKIYRPATRRLRTRTVQAYDEAVLFLGSLETVWIEVELESCDSVVTLTGTRIESSYEIAVFSAQGICNEAFNSLPDTSNDKTPDSSSSYDDSSSSYGDYSGSGSYGDYSGSYDDSLGPYGDYSGSYDDSSGSYGDYSGSYGDYYDDSAYYRDYSGSDDISQGMDYSGSGSGSGSDSYEYEYSDSASQDDYDYDTSDTVPFSYIVSPLRQLPPVSRWGKLHVTDLKKLALFSEDDSMQFFIVSFSILSSARSEVTISCYGTVDDETICKAAQVVGKGEVWRYELHLKTMLQAEVVVIEGDDPILVLHEVYSQGSEYHSELLQPAEWHLRKQMVPILYPLGPVEPESNPDLAFAISLVVPNQLVETEYVTVWDNRESRSPSNLDEYRLISSYTHTRVHGHTLIRIMLDPAGYDRKDYILQFAMNSTETTMFGASVFAFGGYAFSNGYVLDKCESEQEYELRDNWWIRSKSVGGAVGGVAVFVVAVAIVALFVLCHVKGITILPPPPPPRQGFEYDVFLSFADRDSEFAQKILYDPLTKKGYKVFLHLTNFTAGMTIEDNIMRGISISRVVLYVCSKNFNQSSFCQKELKYGMESHYGKFRGRYRRVVPIVIGGECPAELNTFKIRPIRTSGSVEDYTEKMINRLLKTVNLGKPLKHANGSQNGADFL